MDDQLLVNMGTSYAPISECEICKQLQGKTYFNGEKVNNDEYYQQWLKFKLDRNTAIWPENFIYLNSTDSVSRNSDQPYIWGGVNFRFFHMIGGGFFSILRPEDVLTITICNNCHNVLLWKNFGDERPDIMVTHIRNKDEYEKRCKRVHEIKDFVNDLTNEVSNDLEKLIISKVNKCDAFRKQEIIQEKDEQNRISALTASIKKLLEDRAVKTTVADIAALLKHKDVDEIKELCEEMYQDGEISYAGNGRYFILTEEQEKPKKTSASKSESTEIPEQIKKLSDLKDQGILTEEEFQSKKKDLLDKM